MTVFTLKMLRITRKLFYVVRVNDNNTDVRFSRERRVNYNGPAK